MTFTKSLFFSFLVSLLLFSCLLGGPYQQVPWLHFLDQDLLSSREIFVYHFDVPASGGAVPARMDLEYDVLGKRFSPNKYSYVIESKIPTSDVASLGDLSSVIFNKVDANGAVIANLTVELGSYASIPDSPFLFGIQGTGDDAFARVTLASYYPVYSADAMFEDEISDVIFSDFINDQSDGGYRALLVQFNYSGDANFVHRALFPKQGIDSLKFAYSSYVYTNPIKTTSYVSDNPTFSEYDAEGGGSNGGLADNDLSSQHRIYKLISTVRDTGRQAILVLPFISAGAVYRPVAGTNLVTLPVNFYVQQSTITDAGWTLADIAAIGVFYENPQNTDYTQASFIFSGSDFLVRDKENGLMLAQIKSNAEVVSEYQKMMKALFLTNTSGGDLGLTRWEKTGSSSTDNDSYLRMSLYFKVDATKLGTAVPHSIDFLFEERQMARLIRSGGVDQ